MRAMSFSLFWPRMARRSGARRKATSNSPFGLRTMEGKAL